MTEDPIQPLVPVWTGKIRCGICGHERRLVGTTLPVPIDPVQRYDCPICNPRLKSLYGIQVEG